MKKTFFLVVLLELVIIFFIAFNLYSKLATEPASINPIKKDRIAIERTGGLEHFYEPRPGTIDQDLDNSPINAVYTINRDSLNERFDYNVEKGVKIYRIVTLGDSYTYGLYVDTKDNWTERLEDKLNKLDCPNIEKFEVINLGVHGYDTRYEVERYEKRGQKYHPDLVVWFFVDLLRIDEKLIPLSSKYEKSLGAKDDYYLPWRTARNEIQEKLGADAILDYQRKSLELFNAHYKGQLLVVPSWRITRKSREEMLLKEFSKRKDGYFTDILQDAPNQGLLFPKDPHPNQKGHEYIAEKVFNHLLDGQFFVCR